MVFDWLFGRKKRSQSDRTERNAVIRRIVTANRDQFLRRWHEYFDPID